MKVGVVGLGNMGSLIAGSLVRAGLETSVYDVRPEAVDALAAQGARGTGSVKELAGQADTVAVVVLNEAQVDLVADDVASVGAPRRLVVHSTVTPAFVQRLAARMAPQQVTVLDAPVAGGLARARTGDLTVTVGGDDADVAALAPVFDAIGRQIFHVGPPGAGSAAKLAVNYLTIAGYTLQMEAMEFARAYGLSEDSLSSVLTTSNADSRAVRTWGVQDRVRRSGSPGTAPVDYMMRKDLVSFATAAGTAGFVAPMAGVAAETIVGRLAERDRHLDSLGEVEPIPRCSVCTLELIPPFRAEGVHPECRGA